MEPNTLSQGLYRYGAKGLAALWAIYLLGWWFAFVGEGNVAIFLTAEIVLTCLCVGLFFLDGRNYGTLYGLLPWGKWSVWVRVVMVVVCLALLALLPLPYLLMATTRHFRAVGKSPTEYGRQLLHNFAGAGRKVQVVVVVGSLVGLTLFCAGTSLAASAPRTMQPIQQLLATTPTAPTQPHPTNTSHPHPTVTPRPRPTATPQNPLVVYQQTVQRIASQNCGYTTNNVQAVYSAAYNAAEVTVTLGEQWDVSTAQNSVKIAVFDCFKGFYTSLHASFVQDVHILVQGPVTDAYGNTSTGLYGDADLTRATAANFNWDNLDPFQAWDNSIYDSQYVRSS